MNMKNAISSPVICEGSPELTGIKNKTGGELKEK